MKEICWVISDRTGTIIKRNVSYDECLEVKQQCDDKDIPVIILKEITND